MRCHICNAVLGEKEIQISREHKDFEPCGTCLEVISDVFSNEDEDIIDEQLDFEFLIDTYQEVKDDAEESS